MASQLEAEFQAFVLEQNIEFTGAGFRQMIDITMPSSGMTNQANRTPGMCFTGTTVGRLE